MIEPVDLMAISPAVEIYSHRVYCRSCNGRKSLPYTKEQLDLECDGVKKFFKDVWMKGIKPMGKKVGAKILNDSVKAFQVASQIGLAVTSRNP